MLSLVPFACLALISNKPILSKAKMSARCGEVVDLLSSSSDSSSSSSLPIGIGPLCAAPVMASRTIEEIAGKEVDHCDEESSLSSMDASLFSRHEIDEALSQQIDNSDDDSSSDIEVISNPSREINNSDACSSSLSSGIPGQSPVKRATAVRLDEKSTAIASVASSKATSSTMKNTTKRRNTKRRAWGRTSKSSKTKNNSEDESIPSALPTKQSSTFNHCYLLRSLDPDHPLKTYIGFTTHPSRRIRQHNGILKNGGARRTRRSGRPWTFCCIVGGFESKTAALQFEWAWQNVGKSKAFREAVGDDALARKMGRRRGVKARLEEMRVLLNACKPWCESGGFTVYFMEEAIHLQFCEILGKTETIEGSGRTDMLRKQVCAVEEMPFAIDLKAKKKRGKKKAADISSDISEVAASHDDASEVDDSKLSAVYEDLVHNFQENDLSSSSSQPVCVNVDSLDLRNLSIEQKTKSWEDLSPGSGIESNEQENAHSNTAYKKPDRYDILETRSWEDLSLDSDIKTSDSFPDEVRENLHCNSDANKSVDVYDLCDSP
jgi:predicted GIY-YIG superfamily endonuclease